MQSLTSCWMQGTTPALLAVMWTLLYGGSLSAGDWPQWLGPTRDSASTEKVAPWEGELKPVWKRDIASGFASLIVADGMLFAHTAVANQDAQEEVLALDALTGEVKWQKAYARAPYRSDLGNGPRATPTLVNGRLYTLGITGVLTCWDARTGQQHWQANPYEELRAPQPGFGVCSSPVVVDQRVVLPVGGSGHGAVAYDAQTGKIAWKALDEPAGSAAPVVISRRVGELTVNQVVVQTTLRIAGLNPASGEVLWQHPLVFEPSGVSPTPLVVGDKLVCSTQDTGTLALTLPTSAGSSPGQAWWKQDISSYFSTGGSDSKGRVFIITNALTPLPRADILCLDSANGNTVWKKEGLGYFHLGLIRTADDRLLILDDGGNLTLAEVGAGEYRELCKAKVCGGTFSSPALANGRVYVRDGSSVVCVQVAAPQE